MLRSRWWLDPCCYTRQNVDQLELLCLEDTCEEMTMPRWMLKHTKGDKIANEVMWNKVGKASVTNKMRGARF